MTLLVMPAQPTSQNITDLIRTNIAKKSYARPGNITYKQNVLAIDNKT